MDQADLSSPRARLMGWGAVLLLVVLIGRALYATLDTVLYQPHSDDGYYLRYMSEVAERGLGALPAQFRFYLSSEQHWIFPPPSRVGFTLVCAAWSQLFGASLRSLSYLSLGSHLALIVVTFAFTQRWFATTRAVLIAALIGFSTLHLGLARAALTDVFVSLVQVCAIGLFVEYIRDPTRKLRAISFALVFAFAMLTKEIAVLLAIPFGLYAALERWFVGRDIPIGRTLTVLIAPCIACVLGWVLAAGGASTVFHVMEIVLLSPRTNVYAQEFGSGGWFRYPVDEILMAPWPTLLGLAGVSIALWRWRERGAHSLELGLALVYAAQIGVLSFFTKNLRYVAVLEFPLRVLAVGVLWEVSGGARSKHGRALCIAAVALICASSWLDFRALWLDFQLYDPVTGALVMGREMTPRPPR